MTETKHCSTCNQTKDVSCFSRKGENYQAKCKACCKIYRDANKEHLNKIVADWAQKNKQRKQAVAKKRYEENREEILRKNNESYERNKSKRMETARKWRLRNKNRIAEYGKNWIRANRHIAAATCAKRRAKQLQAQPIWASEKAIREVYAYAKFLSETHGIAYEVDHIVPLSSKLVCGLHCEYNLVAITRTQNRTKSNTIWPDMP